MRIVRFKTGEDKPPLYGIQSEDHVTVMVASPFEGIIVGTSEKYPLDQVRLLCPTVPTKIVAVGLNYRDHARELNMEVPQEPLLFLKPPSSVVGPGDVIKLPEMSQQVDYEAELAIVIGQRAKDVPVENADAYILGYTCLNDVTARDLQRKDVQFTRSKGFDTFCPIGPWIETEIEPSDLEIRCILNGEVRQDSRTSQLIHSPQSLLSFISRIMTLEPGDVIATGTPKGIGQLAPGDEVVVSIGGIGELINTVER